MKTGIIIITTLFISVLVAGCIQDSSEITNFEECLAAGYDIMESHPRQCVFGDQIFVEEITLSIEEAISLAGPCLEEGTLTENAIHNENTNTWWIDLEPFEPLDGCNPACVIYEITGEAEINWRCTGALP
ncbi:hypothetical protein ACFLQN_02720 [Candidatus Aenigmatarchaeota archaeon]